MSFPCRYLFATLSKKSKRIAKNGLRRLSYTLKFQIKSDEVLIEIQKDGGVHSFDLIIVPTHLKDFECDASNQFCSKVDDIRESSIDLLSFLEDLFNISRFDLHTYHLPNDFTKQFLATVKRLRISIFKLIVVLENPDDEMFGWIMENCQDVKRLTNVCQTTENFRWDLQEPFLMEYLSLWYAPWLTVDHMTRLFMNCRFFELTSHQFTTDNLIQFVKVWMIDSNMEYFATMVNRNIGLAYILKDIEKEPVQRAFVENNLLEFEQNKAFKIRQECGKEAVVCVWEEEFIITVHFDNPNCDFWEEEELEEEELEGGAELVFEDEDSEDGDLEEEDEDDEEEDN
ncbi:hypothetical protein CAEBREN_04902 [Caenorhabditis brenneri]|uniref:Sdz-33 F-box domain-containing protein n=1 Tax=Caenorhabditis brenneri TaxID=135651 RepID=G0PH63_CAEBE|nr:hypothetical protein CAEBREN_04902 [Caenorhabditis brenneri]